MTVKCLLFREKSRSLHFFSLEFDLGNEDRFVLIKICSFNCKDFN